MKSWSFFIHAFFWYAPALPIIRALVSAEQHAFFYCNCTWTLTQNVVIQQGFWLGCTTHVYCGAALHLVAQETTQIHKPAELNFSSFWLVHAKTRIPLLRRTSKDIRRRCGRGWLVSQAGLAGSRRRGGSPTPPRDPRPRAKSATRDPRPRATPAALPSPGHSASCILSGSSMHSP